MCGIYNYISETVYEYICVYVHIYKYIPGAVLRVPHTPSRPAASLGTRTEVTRSVSICCSKTKITT
jgi:hypothetical protein